MNKILFYLPTAGSRVEDSFTGAPKRLLSLVTALTEKGLSATLCTERDTLLFRKAEERHLQPLDYSLPHILTTRGGYVFKRNPIIQCKVIWGAFSQTLRFARLIWKHQFDTIWLRGSKGILLGGLSARLAGAKIVWDIDYEPASKGVISLIHKFGLKISSKVVFQYEGCAAQVFGESLAKQYAHKMVSLIPGIETVQLESSRTGKRPCGDRPSFTLLHAGTLCDRKNQLFTLKLVEKFLHKHSKYPLKVLFAGGVFDEDYAGKLEQLIRRADLENVVTLLGWRDDVPNLMSAADALILPSLDEGVPNTAQEAMYLGLPCITSTAGGLPEIICHQETGWIQSLTDKDQWLASLEEAVFNCVKRTAVSEHAQTFAQQNFTMDAWGEKYAKILRDVK